MLRSRLALLLLAAWPVATLTDLIMSHTLDDEGYWSGWWTVQPWLGTYDAHMGIVQWLSGRAGFALAAALLAPIPSSALAVFLAREPRHLFLPVWACSGAAEILLWLANDQTGAGVARALLDVGPEDLAIGALFGLVTAIGAVGALLGLRALRFSRTSAYRG